MDLVLEKRRVVINDENQGPIVSIVSILLLISVLFTVLTRLSFRYFRRRRLTLEDGLVFLAAVLSIGELATVLGLDINGLGSPVWTLSADQLNRFQQYSYAGNVLYVLNLGLTKISVLLLIHDLIDLTPRKGQKVAIWLAIGFTASWMTSSVLTLFFQCHVPQTWRFINNQCINRTNFWIFYIAVHILTELVLILLPVWVIWKLKMSRGKKSLALLPFSLRILVIIPAIAQLAYLIPTHSSNDPTFDLWRSVFCGQITQTFAIMTACFIQLKPFFTSLNSGLLQHTERVRHQRYGSRNQSGYLSLSHKSTDVRSPNRQYTRALPTESSLGARDPWSPYEEDMIESAHGYSNVTPTNQTPRGIHQTTSIAIEYSKKDSDRESSALRDIGIEQRIDRDTKY